MEDHLASTRWPVVPVLRPPAEAREEEWKTNWRPARAAMCGGVLGRVLRCRRRGVAQQGNYEGDEATHSGLQG